MGEPRSYVVRIYRRGYRSLSGVVEDTRTSGQRSFRNADELITALRCPGPLAAPGEQSPSSKPRRKTP